MRHRRFSAPEVRTVRHAGPPTSLADAQAAAKVLMDLILNASPRVRSLKAKPPAWYLGMSFHVTGGGEHYLLVRVSRYGAAASVQALLPREVDGVLVQVMFTEPIPVYANANMLSAELPASTGESPNE